MGLTNWLKPTDHGHWEMNPETGIARRTEKLASIELETCAACHSRRKVIVKSPRPGEPFLDGYLPALLEPGLYHGNPAKTFASARGTAPPIPTAMLLLTPTPTHST
jgi:hypothetical protein